jgi:nucleoside-diphosphate-sugar epimerase
MTKTVAVFGANGQVGRAFIQYALESGNYNVRAFVRNASKFSEFIQKIAPSDSKSTPSKLEIVEGDATNESDIKRAIEGVDYVTSFLGNPHPNPNNIFIMYEAANQILNAAAKEGQDEKKMPKCLFTSSVGVGGSSWLIGGILSLIGGKEGFQDYERAEERIRGEKTVQFGVVRPYALTDGEAKGYQIIPGKTAHCAKAIARKDVAKYFMDCLDGDGDENEESWIGKCTNIGGA